jgi:hypothetical protein
LKIKKPMVTILTDPVPDGVDYINEYFVRLLRSIKYFFLKKNIYGRNLKYRGHYAVTRSIVEGLKKNGSSFNYNPKKFSELADIVHVVSGSRALKQMLVMKKRGKLKKLYAGPNIAVFSTDYNSILAAPEIDGLVNHCEDACKIWALDNELLLNKCFIWPAGVDTDFWRPNDSLIRDTILVFDKRTSKEDASRTAPILNYLRSKNYSVEIIVRSPVQGYSQNSYLSLLKRSCLLIGFTVGSESQGIAWAEAWSCNVPTLILQNRISVYQGRRFECTTAPYLNKENGLFFDNFDNFKLMFDYWEKNKNQFRPRDWVLKNMSDEVSAKRLFDELTKNNNHNEK